MLKPFAHEVWTADGPDVVIVGFHYPTRMAVIRLSDRSLFIWSPIQLTDGLRAEVDALGQVRHIIAPNSLHHLFLPEWKRAYPGAKIYAPPGLRRKRRDIVFDADLGAAPDPDWAREIDQVLMRGNLITTEVVFFHTKSGTVLFTDLLSSFPPVRSPAGGHWWRNWTTSWSARSRRCRASFVSPLPIAAPRVTRWTAFSPGPPRMC